MRRDQQDQLARIQFGNLVRGRRLEAWELSETGESTHRCSLRAREGTGKQGALSVFDRDGGDLLPVRQNGNVIER
jgi:hypothetical protein